MPASSITPADLATYVINLPRRPDRRAWITRHLPRQLHATFTSDWAGPFDGHQLTVESIEAAGLKLFPWRIDSDNPWWNRPLKLGEIGCSLAHLACWRHSAANGKQPYVLVLEDDAILPPTFLDDLLHTLRYLAEHGRRFDLLYLGRYPLEPDRPALPGFVVPGYSHCTYAYLLTRAAVPALLAAGLDQAIIPIDEFLPARDPSLVRQRPKPQAGSDIEHSAFAGA